MPAVDAVRVGPLDLAEVDVAGRRRQGAGLGARQGRRVQLVDLGGDPGQGVRVDVAVVERHVHAGAVVPYDRRVDQVRPAQRVRDGVEAVLEVLDQLVRVVEVARLLPVQGDVRGVQREPAQLVSYTHL